jgi:hypothetical protein
VRRFDLDCANLLTDVYGLQETAVLQIMHLADLIGERETHEPERLSETLIVLDLGVQELLGREWLLGQTYEQALETLSAEGCDLGD